MFYFILHAQQLTDPKKSILETQNLGGFWKYLWDKIDIIHEKEMVCAMHGLWKRVTQAEQGSASLIS